MGKESGADAISVSGNGSDDRWLVAMTQPHMEALAMSHLKHQGFRVYCPMVRKRIRHARRSLDVKRPLFSGYVFVAFEEGRRWQAIRSTVGLQGLVQRGDAPDYLDGSFVKALRDREAEGVIAKLPSPFRPGQLVGVTHGPFANLIGEIIAMRDNERTMMLLHLMGRKVKTLIDTDALSPRM
ncbi:MAG: transcription termination/antitermination protein NusG [Boseongicola sp.]